MVCAVFKNLIVMARRYSNFLKYLVFQSQSRKSALAAFVEQWAQWGDQSLDASKVRLDVIDTTAIGAFNRWGGDNQFPWEDVPDWKALDVKGFDLSIWHDEQLCGLCYATPRDSKVTIKIVLLEGSPDSQHPLKGLIAALALAPLMPMRVSLVAHASKFKNRGPMPYPLMSDLALGLTPGNAL